MGAVNQPWHIRGPDALRALENELADAYPTLHVVVAGEDVTLKGSYPVRDGAEVLDWYSVEVTLAPNHPAALPKVQEVGGRIPWLLDRHVLPDGSACVVLPDAYWLSNAPGKVSVLEFLSGPMRDYYLGQSLVELGEPWPQGEWAHGTKGIVQHYSAFFGVGRVASICGLLLGATKLTKGHLPCPCGSGERYRNCHRARVQRVAERIPQAVLWRALELLALELRGSSATPPAR